MEKKRLSQQEQDHSDDVTNEKMRLTLIHFHKDWLFFYCLFCIIIRNQRAEEEEKRKCAWEKSINLQTTGLCERFVHFRVVVFFLLTIQQFNNSTNSAECPRLSKKITEDQTYYRIKCSKKVYFLELCIFSINNFLCYPFLCIYSAT
jgi:hypothetical protein